MLQVEYFLMCIITGASKSGQFRVLFDLATRSQDLEHQPMFQLQITCD